MTQNQSVANIPSEKEVTELVTPSSTGTRNFLAWHMLKAILPTQQLLALF